MSNSSHWSTWTYSTYSPSCEHCWHPFEGALWMVLPPSLVLANCCKCGAQQTTHRDHCYRRAGF